MKKILYLGWIGKANVGDELLFDIFKKMINKAAFKNKIAVNIDLVVINDDYITNYNEYDLVVLGGGSLLTLEFWDNYCNFLSKINVSYITWGTGIDSRDQNFVEKVLTNYNEDNRNNKLAYVDNRTLNVINRAKYASVRGKIDKFLLNNLGQIDVIGDPGIIYNQLENKYPSGNTIEKIIQFKEKYILINWGHSFNNILGKNESELFDNISKVIQILVNKGEKILIYPIWDKDIEICKKLGSQFNLRQVKTLTKVYDAYYIMQFINRSKYTINFKLHANILSYAMNKPFISLSYGLKGYDFVDSVGLNQLSLFTNNASVKNIRAKIDFVEKNYNSILKKIKTGINKYNRAINNSIDEIINLLLEDNSSSNETRPVFILGSGRSGTHLLGYVLDSNINTITTIEKPEIFNRVVKYATGQEKNNSLYVEIKKLYQEELKRCNKSYYIDKSHPNIWLAEKLSSDFKKSKFIGIIRDPFATVSSMLNHKGVRSWCENWHKLPTPNDFLGINNENKEDYEKYSLVQKCALRWKSHREKMYSLKEKLGKRLLIISYEELVTNPRLVKNQLKEFLDLNSDFLYDNFKKESLVKWKKTLTVSQIEEIEEVIKDIIN